MLVSLGFTTGESDALRRISLTLHRWAEHECNGIIERDETRQNRPFWSNLNTGRHFVAPAADRERGALMRVGVIVSALGAHFYHQTDPRGAALYVAGEKLTDQNYSSVGICCAV